MSVRTKMLMVAVFRIDGSRGYEIRHISIIGPGVGFSTDP